MNIKLSIKLNSVELNYEGDDSFFREQFEKVLALLSNPAGGTSARPVVVSPVYEPKDQGNEGSGGQASGGFGVQIVVPNVPTSDGNNSGA